MGREKILLVMLPFNDPQIPPLGLANLKSFLKRGNCDVTTVDANVEVQFREIFDRYFQVIGNCIPEENRGNFYSMRLDILQNQMTAYLNYRNRLDIPRYRKMETLPCKNREEYVRLVKMLIYSTFYVEAADMLVDRLDDIITGFYQRLEDYFLDLLRQVNPTVLGLSVCIGMLGPSLFAFKLAKELYPHIKTVMGGGIYADDLALHSPNLDYFVENTPYIDKLIVGEGEILFDKYLKGELPLSQKVYGIHDINGEVVDLSGIDIPDFEDFKLERYPYMSANASNGCLYNCAFCTIPNQWGRYRNKTPDRVVTELTDLYRKYGTQLFLIVDSLLNPLMTPLAREFIKSDIAIYWDGSLKVSKDVCKTGNTLLWRKGGFYRAHIGIETGSQRVLDLMDKRITVEQIKAAITSLAYAGIKTTTFWVVGYPGETEEDFLHTLNLVEELKDDIYETTIRPYLHYLTRQETANDHGKKSKSILLYPEETRDKLMVQTWIKDSLPSREETFKRLNRFNQHIVKLGIPNPYSLNDIHKADIRWEKLHGNSVPPLVAFKDTDAYIDECKHVEEICLLQNTLEDDGSFGL